MATMDSGGTANDPFTGRPAEPADPAMLHLISRGNAMFCFHSIPGTLYYIDFILYPEPEHQMNAPRCPKFKLECHDQNQATYTRLYTRWLYSGNANPDLARVHSDGTISFSRITRDCIFWARKSSPMGATPRKIYTIIQDIANERSSLPAISETHWTSLILRTEPIEKSENIWIHALPTHTPSTQQPQPPPHPFNTALTNVPYGWTTWKPLTVPASILPRPPPTHIDPILTAPTHLRHIHSIDRRRAEGIPNITAKEDATPATFDLQNPRNSSRNGILKIRAYIREQLSHTVNPPKRNTRRRKRQVQVPLNLDFGMFGYPTATWDEFESEDETEDERLDYEVQEAAKTDAELDEMAEGTANLAHVEMGWVLKAEMASTLLDRKKMGLRKMERDEEAMTVGFAGTSAANTLFVSSDWE